MSILDGGAVVDKGNVSFLAYDDYAQSANTLFNFMEEEKYLKGILQQKAIKPRYCVETVDYLNIHMYISFSAYLSEEDAQKEADSIMKHKESYINAKTIQAHIESYTT